MKLYSSKATREEVMTTNGLYNLDEVVLNSVITERLNGDFILEASLLKSDNIFNPKIYDLIEKEYIIKDYYEGREEIFRIVEVIKNKTRIDIRLRQITQEDSLNLFLKDVRPENTNGQGALAHMYNLSEGRNKYHNYTSDIGNTSTAYYQNMSLYEALFKCEQSFINRWGGEVSYNQYNCRLNASVGMDKGVKIQSKKNLKGFEIKDNNQDLCTRIVPRGFDGIEANTVDSPLINNYSAIYTKVIKWEDVKVKNENNPDEGYDTLEQAQAELTRRAKEQFEKFNADKLKVTYTVDFVDLSKTEQYKDFSIMETVEIGDIVTVKEDIYGTEIKARVVEIKYSPKLKRRIEVKISNVDFTHKPISIDSIIKDLEASLDVIKRPSLADYINDMINAGLKDSYVVLKPNELLIMDNKDVNKAKNVTRYNKNGLGFSTTGYYGKYEYGFTIDGKINASLISTGVLSTVLIQNADGSVRLDLSKPGGLDFYNNGHKSVSINHQKVEVYDWEDTTREVAVGSIQSVRKEGNVIKPAMQLSHELGAGMSIAYKLDQPGGWYGSYIDFDIYKVFDQKFLDYIDMFGEVPNNLYDATARKSIMFGETVLFRDWVDFDVRPRMIWGTWYGANSECVVNYSPTSGRMFTTSPWGFEVNNQENTQSMFRAQREKVTAWNSNGVGHFHSEEGKFSIGDVMYTTTGGGVYCNKPFTSANFLIESPELMNIKSNERIFNHETENAQLDIKHELYKKDLEIEDLKNRIAKLEEIASKVIQLL